MSRRLMAEAERQTYRLKGAQAFREGKPYTDCPYLPFSDCEEGMAWKNGWLAAKENWGGDRRSAKIKEKP
jgi:hypothetical protein